MVEMDWWSKYYASTGETAKSMNYIEQGYDKVPVCSTTRQYRCNL